MENKQKKEGALLEACADSFVSCLSAERGGADRIELCGQLLIGGVTPSYELFRRVREKIGIKINVLIRPRFGDFLYSEEETEQMCREIRAFRLLGADGVVVGALTPEGELDEKKMERFRLCAEGMEITLHRAFDLSRDPFETLERAVGLGIDTILTSGQRQTATEGAELLKALKVRAGGRIAVMAGGGVRSGNLAALHEKTGITVFHTSARKRLDSGMIFRRGEVSMGFASVSEYDRFELDEEELAACAAIVRGMR